MLKLIIKTLFTIMVVLFTCVACTKSGGGGDDSDGNDNTGGGDTSGSSFRTDCGTVRNSEIQNPVSSNDGLSVTISNAGTEGGTVVIIRDGGQQLVKLRALATNLPPFQASTARNVINGFPKTALLYTDNCSVTTPEGAAAIVGDLFSSTGTSLTESLLKQNGAAVNGNGSCSEARVAGCYQALIDSNPIETGGTISNFLWKPQSERDGRLVVLLNPGGATIVVNGETLTSTGPSNGRGTTARGNQSGGAFGTNVRVEAFDSQGRPLVFPTGVTTLIIANGSQRVEL